MENGRHRLGAGASHWGPRAAGEEGRGAGAQAVEGQIKEGDAAWESVPPGDRPRRKRAVDDKARERTPRQNLHRWRLMLHGACSRSHPHLKSSMPYHVWRCECRSPPPAGERGSGSGRGGAQALKLKSPNFSISRTRLAVRNIPASMNEAALKKLAIQAVRAAALTCRPAVCGSTPSTCPLQRYSLI